MKTKNKKYAVMSIDTQDVEDSGFECFILAKDENEAWEKLAKHFDLDEQVGDLKQAVEILRAADDVQYSIIEWNEAEIEVIK